MTAYVIADVQVTDTAAYEPYRPLAAASIARFGGRFVVRGGAVLCDWRLPADGGYIGQRAHYRGHITPAGQGRNDPARACSGVSESGDSQRFMDARIF